MGGTRRYPLKEKFVAFFRWEIQSLAFRSLSHSAVRLLIEFKSLYNASNNGQIYLSVREAARRIDCSNNTAAKALKELQAKGFIKARELSNFDRKTGTAISWILTEFPYNNKGATKDFMAWKPEEKRRCQNLNQSGSDNDTAAYHNLGRPPVSVLKSDTVESQNGAFGVSGSNTQLIYHGQAAGEADGETQK